VTACGSSGNGSGAAERDVVGWLRRAIRKRSEDARSEGGIHLLRLIDLQLRRSGSSMSTRQDVLEEFLLNYGGTLAEVFELGWGEDGPDVALVKWLG